MVDISIGNAAQAYQNATKLMDSSGLGQDKVGKTDFSDLLSGAVGNAVETVRAGEHASVQAMLGEITLDELGTALTNAEMSLQAMVAVRDRIITAYQDIIKMPI